MPSCLRTAACGRYELIQCVGFGPQLEGLTCPSSHRGFELVMLLTNDSPSPIKYEREVCYSVLFGCVLFKKHETYVAITSAGTWGGDEKNFGGRDLLSYSSALEIHCVHILACSPQSTKRGHKSHWWDKRENNIVIYNILMWDHSQESPSGHPWLRQVTSTLHSQLLSSTRLQALRTCVLSVCMYVCVWMCTLCVCVCVCVCVCRGSMPSHLEQSRYY